jgi:hypothetical protein
MPVVSQLYYQTKEDWEWHYHEDAIKKFTEEKMLSELKELEKFRKQYCPKVALKELVDAINDNGVLIIGKHRVNFGELHEAFMTWEHLTGTCQHMVREWVAQDESHVKCEVGKHCDNEFDPNCKDCKPMIDSVPLEKLLGKKTFVFR